MESTLHDNTTKTCGDMGMSVPQDHLAMKSCIQHSAHLANLGAHFLSVGNDGSAFGAFKRSLDILQSIAGEHDLDALIMTAQDNLEMNEDPEAILPPVAIPFDCDINDASLYGTNEADKTVFFVYSKPFVLDQRALDVACTPVYIAAILFDMTLVMLRRAAVMLDHKKFLHKALRIFDMALLLLRSAPNHVDSSNLLLACLNNKVHTCYCLHEFEDAHSALDELSILLPVACESSTFEEEELNGMILNSLLPADPTRMATAA